MKNLFRFLTMAIMVIAIACNETEITPTAVPNDPADDSRTLTAARKKLSSPTSFTLNGRIYELEYNADGTVSTIIAVENGNEIYRYVAHYTNGKLTSADLVENGAVMSSNTNFVRDENGNVVEYDYVSYFFPELPDGLVEHKTVSYDNNGNLSPLPDGTVVEYDKYGNIVQAGSTTYEYKKNQVYPLGSLQDLWLILVEESGYVFNTIGKSVRTSETRADGSTIEYVNIFEKKYLISQSIIVNGVRQELISFTY